MPSVWSKSHETWELRLSRAQELAARNPASGEVLSFYHHVLQFQATLCDVSTPANADAPVNISAFRSVLDSPRAAASVPRVMAMVKLCGPANLAAEIAEWGEVSPERIATALQDWLSTDGDQPAGLTFLSRVLLEPQAERLAAALYLRPTVVGNRCPACAGAPQLAVIRPEGDGGKRFLLCSFCHTEWEFRRILCPSCGELDHEKLPRYSAEDLPAVRVEACDTCRRYLKSVDLTLYGHAVPLVDEVASAALDLWASEQGYRKLVPNIMGF